MQRASSSKLAKPPQPVKAPKPATVEPRTVQRQVPSLPRLTFMDEGR